MEFLSLVVPRWNNLTHKTLDRGVFEVLTTWQQGHEDSIVCSVDSIYTNANATITVPSVKESTISSTTLVDRSHCLLVGPDKPQNQQSPQLTMSALDHTLKWNPEPLQRFASLIDFTGENISFLIHLSEWKQCWKLHKHRTFSLPSEYGHNRAKQRRLQFNRAIRIYAAFVSMHTAEFPVNLPAKQRRGLEDLFDRPARVLYGAYDDNCEEESSSASTINAEDYDRDSTFDRPAHNRRKNTHVYDRNRIAPFTHLASSYSVNNTHPISTSTLPMPSNTIPSGVDIDNQYYSDDYTVWYWGPVPPDFNATVFDDAEREIRYLVWTNTWPKYVSCMEGKSGGGGKRAGGRGSIIDLGAGGGGGGGDEEGDGDGIDAGGRRGYVGRLGRRLWVRLRRGGRGDV